SCSPDCSRRGKPCSARAKVAEALLLFAYVAAGSAGGACVFVLARRLRPGRRGHSHAAAAAAAVILFIALYLALAPLGGIFLVPGLAMILCNAYVMFHFDNMGETARRIRILRELCRAPGGLSRQAILAAYPPREVFERRIGRFLAAGQCRQLDGRLAAAGESYSLMEKVVTLFARVVFRP